MISLFELIQKREENIEKYGKFFNIFKYKINDKNEHFYDSLEYLYIDFNDFYAGELDQISFEIDKCELKNIQSFEIINIGLIDLPIFGDKCTYINVSNNNIEMINKKIGAKNVTQFNCNSNKLKNLNFLSECQELRTLEAKENDIEEFNITCKKLLDLDLQANKKLKKVVFQNYRSLDIRETEIKDIDENYTINDLLMTKNINSFDKILKSYKKHFIENNNAINFRN